MPEDLPTPEKSIQQIEREADQHADAMTDEEFKLLRGYAV